MQKLVWGINLWCSDPTKALKQYGHISEFSEWNTSNVTTMKKLFEYTKDFNDEMMEIEYQ